MSIHANRVHKEAGVEPEADIELLDRAIRDIELGLVDEDPDFVRRVRRPARTRRTNVIIVFALLVATTLLLAFGLATYSWFALVAGALAFMGAFAVDDHHRRRLA
jgi:hypothetical protein